MISPQIIAETIGRTLDGLDQKQIRAMSKRIVQVFNKRNELGVLKKSLALVKSRLEQHQGLTTVEVTSARKLSKITLELVAKKLNLPFQQVNFVLTEDPTLIAGMVARTADLEIDARLQARINRFLS